ncbi:MAG: acetyl-CoA carboxylase carboxyl transferase subunit alpha [Clostridia bacterium]|nr:acetyl-CoA carboxylase carboxyl transferase subunit alpha [Clostridia bacterium]
MSTMTPYERLTAARSRRRPTALRYVEGLFRKPVELHGDRCLGDDAAIIAGVAYLEDIPVTYIAIEKGATIEQRILRNFGSPRPEGYRKALRLMKQAEKFGRPVICIVDTAGAACDADAETHGQGMAIAKNLAEMMALEVPVISVLIGEGGSGGALALAVSDRVYMLENAVYSVITAEGCASILWRDSAKAPVAAQCLKITAEDMKRLGVVEEIIPEDFNHFSAMRRTLRALLCRDIKMLGAMPRQKLLADRYSRFRRIGDYAEEQSKEDLS